MKLTRITSSSRASSISMKPAAGAMPALFTSICTTPALRASLFKASTSVREPTSQTSGENVAAESAHLGRDPFQGFPPSSGQHHDGNPPGPAPGPRSGRCRFRRP